VISDHSLWQVRRHEFWGSFSDHIMYILYVGSSEGVRSGELMIIIFIQYYNYRDHIYDHFDD